MAEGADDDDEVEMALVIDTADSRLAGDLAELYPDLDLSSSENFVGGAEIAVFFAYAKDVLQKLLGFVAQNRGRIKAAKVTIGPTSISLEGYSADEADRLLSSPGFKNAMKSVRQR